jgi:hypothetical protein
MTPSPDSARATAAPRYDVGREPSLTETPKIAAARLPGELSCSCTIRKDVVRWLAPVALFLAFVLSFFTWLAAAPNGTVIYAQNGWQAMRGGFSVDLLGDEVLAKERVLNESGGVSGWLLLYLVVLVITTIFVIGDLVLTLLDLTVPDVFKPLWPHRGVLAVGLTALLLIALAPPAFSAFGLESAAVAAAEKEVPPLSTKPDGSPPTTKELQLRDVRRDVAVASFAVRRTGWFHLVVLFQLTALVGAAMTLWLDRRGDRPEPRLECYC